MHNFNQLTKQIIYAEMFGFHFDVNADITIECDVKVCGSSSSSDKSCVFQGVSIAAVKSFFLGDDYLYTHRIFTSSAKYINIVRNKIPWAKTNNYA